MKLRTRHKIEVQFSMSSMTDIVFLLLIFFMLMASFITPQVLSIDLPTSNHSENLPPAGLNVSITAALDYYVEQQQVTREQLKDLLWQKLFPQCPVWLHVDKSVPIEHVIYVTDLAAASQAKLLVVTQSE